jgi:RNA polymerase sigma factor (sigma-70 family)
MYNSFNFNDILSESIPIDPEKQADLFYDLRKIKGKDLKREREIEDELFKMNLLLVPSGLKYAHASMDDDSFQDACVCLFDSIRGYDFKMNANFSTYYYNNLSFTFMNKSCDGSLVKFTRNIYSKVKKYRKMRDNYVDDEEIEKVIGEPVSKLEEYSKLLDPVYDGEETSVMETKEVAETQELSPEFICEQNEVTETLIKALSKLNTEQVKIISAYSGVEIDGYQFKSMAEYAKERKISRQAVAIKKNKALKKLRSDVELKRLWKEYN